MGAIIDDARKSGELVYEFSQGRSPVMTEPGPWGNAYSGYCAGFAMKWLSLRQQGKDFAFDTESKTMYQPHWHATRDQNVYEDANYDAALKQYGLKKTAHEHHWNGAPTGAKLRQIAQAGAGLYLIRLRRDQGGHAVAMESNTKTNVYHFADANFGHFRFSGAERFGNWLEAFLRDSMYKTRYTKEGFVHQVM